MRLVGVGLLPALAFGAVVAAYELFVVPRVQIGRSVSPATWFVLAAVVGCGLVVTGALAASWSAVVAAAGWAALVWRLLATSLYAAECPGFLKYEPGGLSYWTWQLLAQSLFWLMPIAGGHALWRLLRRTARKRLDAT